MIPIDGNYMQMFRQLWEDIDSIHVHPSEFVGLIERISKLSLEVQVNISSEIRMEFTDARTGFRSMGGWTAAISSVMVMAAKFRKNLFSDFIEKIRKKISDKFQIKLCYFLALLHISPVPNDSVLAVSTVRDMCGNYSVQNAEGQALIEACISGIIGHESFSYFNVSEVLAPLSALLSVNAPSPSEILVSNNESLGSEFSRKVSQFIAKKLPSVSYDSLLVKTGGFLPQEDEGERRIEFGKYRGSEFRSIAKDRGFCDWTERIPEPSSTAFVDWLDYVLKDRQLAVLGPRTVKADIELIRLTILQNKENVCTEKVKNWFLNRAILTQLCVYFYSELLQRFPQASVRDLLAYSICANNVFSHLSNVPIKTFGIDFKLGRPRGEIVKELFRPLVRLSQLVPALRLDIASAILSSRAASHEISIPEAREELKNFHAISL